MQTSSRHNPSGFSSHPSSDKLSRANHTVSRLMTASVSIWRPLLRITKVCFMFSEDKSTTNASLYLQAKASHCGWSYDAICCNPFSVICRVKKNDLCLCLSIVQKQKELRNETTDTCNVALLDLPRPKTDYYLIGSQTTHVASSITYHHSFVYCLGEHNNAIIHQDCKLLIVGEPI
jgi:hypothetical protein